MGEKDVEKGIESSPKTFDPYEDELILNYLNNGKYRVAANKNQVKRILKEAEF